MAQDSKNVYGYTKEEWKKLSFKQRLKLSFGGDLKTFKENLLPVMIGGPVAGLLFSKDENFRKLSAVGVALGTLGAVTKIDPTAGKNAFDALKSKGLNTIDVSKQLTKDQKSALGFMAEQQDFKSNLSFLGSNQAKILTEQGQEYLVNYDSFENLSSNILEAKNIQGADALKIAKALDKQKNSTQVKSFLQKLWRGVWANAPQIIEAMKADGLAVDETTSDGLDGTSGQIEDTSTGKKVESPTAQQGTILGFKTENVILTVGGAGLAYAVFKK